MKPILVLALAALAAGAQAQTAGLRPFVGLGVTGGGDTLATVEYTNGDRQNIKSGGAVEIVGGVEYRQEGLPVSVRGSIAYHFDSSHARNGDVQFARWPVELLALWHPDESISVGAGVRKATGARLTSSGDANIGDYDIGSEVGLVFEAEYRVYRGLGIALRFVGEKYKAPGTGEKIDGNHVGLRVNYHF